MQDAGPVRAFFEDRYKVPGSRFRVSGTRDQIDAEDRGRPLKNTHRVCMMQDRKGSHSGYRVPGTWYLAPLPHIPQTILNKALPLIVPNDVKDSPASPAIIVGHG